MSPPRWQITCIARLGSVLAEVACMDWLECTVVRVLWLACLLASFPMCISPPSSHFRSSHANAASRCLRTALLRSPYLLPFLSLSLSLPFPSVSFSCVLPSHRSSISVVGSLCLLCVWVVGFGYRRRRRRRERESQQQQQQQQEKGGSFCLLDT